MFLFLVLVFGFLVSEISTLSSSSLLNPSASQSSQAQMSPATSSLKTLLLLLLFLTIGQSFVPRKSLNTFHALKGKNYKEAPPNGT